MVKKNGHNMKRIMVAGIMSALVFVGVMAAPRSIVSVKDVNVKVALA